MSVSFWPLAGTFNKQVNTAKGNWRVSFVIRKHFSQMRKGTPMQLRQQIKAALKKNDIPRGLVATLARVYPADLSAWLNGRRELNAAKAEQVRAAVEKVETLLELSPFGVNFKDVDSVKFAIFLEEQFAKFDREFGSLTDEEKIDFRQRVLEAIRGQANFDKAVQVSI
jgi:DNA-binding transcriptional regulator YdaS (Cro superfamily)